MATLIEKFLVLKNNYRNYDTRDSLKRMQTFRRAVQDLQHDEKHISLEILGSISFGIVDPLSDADCVLIHSCKLHGEDSECPEDCPVARERRREITAAMKARLGANMFNLEFLDTINLLRIHKLLRELPSGDELFTLYSFLYYCTIGRPVNRPMFIRYCKLMERDDSFMQGFIEWSSQALASYLQTSSHRESFHKYNERIIHQGLVIPPELEEELRKYLD